jgi:hypothetical protein
MVQQFACRLIPSGLLSGAKYSCISPRGGRGSANTFSLETTSIKLKNNGDDIRLYLEPKMPLISADEPLPPRGDIHEYLFKFNKLPLASKSLVDCWVSVPRLLFGWMVL